MSKRGGYVKRMRGLSVYIKIENPCTLRIQKILVGDEELIKEQEYQVVYITKQGVPFDKYGRDYRDLDIHAVQAMKDLLAGECYIHDQKKAVMVI